MLCEFTPMKVVMHPTSDVGIAKLREGIECCAKQLESQTAKFGETQLVLFNSVYCK